MKDVFDIASRTGKQMTREQADRIVCYLDEAKEVESAEELLHLEVEGQKLLRTVTQQCPYDERIEVIDLKMAGNGFK